MRTSAHGSSGSGRVKSTLDSHISRTAEPTPSHARTLVPAASAYSLKFANPAVTTSGVVETPPPRFANHVLDPALGLPRSGSDEAGCWSPCAEMAFPNGAASGGTLNRRPSTTGNEYRSLAGSTNHMGGSATVAST